MKIYIIRLMYLPLNHRLKLDFEHKPVFSDVSSVQYSMLKTLGRRDKTVGNAIVLLQ